MEPRDFVSQNDIVLYVVSLVSQQTIFSGTHAVFSCTHAIFQIFKFLKLAHFVRKNQKNVSGKKWISIQTLANRGFVWRNMIFHQTKLQKWITHTTSCKSWIHRVKVRWAPDQKEGALLRLSINTRVYVTADPINNTGGSPDKYVILYNYARISRGCNSTWNQVSCTCSTSLFFCKT